jgi:hypothetical protein
MAKWTLEIHVNDWLKEEFRRLGLENQQDYNQESAFSAYLKEALEGSAKTEHKTNFGKPDFSLERNNFPPVIIENKLGIKKLVAKTGNEIKQGENDIKNFAVNGAIHYGKSMIAS